MNDINQIVKNIKHHLSQGKEKVSDKQVAKEIGLSQANNLALHKRRQSIPFALILDWCRLYKINTDKIFYEKTK